MVDWRIELWIAALALCFVCVGGLPPPSCGKELQIPRIVHQLWLARDDAPDQEPTKPTLRDAIAAWRAAAQPAPRAGILCPWSYHLWNRSAAEAFLSSVSPELLTEFQRVQLWPERQKDLFQFAVLAHMGGIFTDVDVVPLQAPEAWFQRHKKMRGSRLLVGVEAQGSEKESQQWRWAATTQLNVWTVAAAPGHPAMLRVLAELLRPEYRFSSAPNVASEYLHSIARGPGLFTRVVDEWLGHSMGVQLPRVASVCLQRRLSVIGDTAILGINGFGCGQPHSRSKPCNETREALVKHLFSGEWKKEEDPWLPIGGRRRRALKDELPDWRLPMLALHAHLNASGIDLPWEAMPLLFASIVPIEPPLLPAP